MTETLQITIPNDFEALNKKDLSEIENMSPEEIELFLSPQEILALSLKSRRIRFKHGHDCCSKLGLNQLFYNASLYWTLSKPESSTIDAFSSQYLITESLFDGGLGMTGALNSLIDSIKEGRVLPSDQIRNYCTMPFASALFGESTGGSEVLGWTKKKIDDDKEVDIYMDAPIGFALAYNQLPACITSFGVSQPKELMLYQIQGVKTYPIKGVIKKKEKRKYGTWALEPLDWQAFLVNTATELAKNVGFESIAIQSAKNNYWVNALDEECQPKLSLESAEKIYDDVARRLGFELGADDNWHKRI